MDQQAMGSKPRSYTEDYKRQVVVDPMASSGRTATAVTAEVGLHPKLLCRWMRQYGASGGRVEAARPLAPSASKQLPAPTADQAAKPDAEHLSRANRKCGFAGIARLRRECDWLRMERDISEKSISIFAGPLR